MNTAHMQSPPTEAQKSAATLLESALQDHDPRLAQDGLHTTYRAGLHRIHASALVALARAPWHFSHEDVVLALQQLRSPETVGILEKTAFAVHDYLGYDEFFGLARKCTWALADVGTTEAQQALERIANCDNPVIAAYAKKRLDNWQKELHRKGV
jgi:hypothetical protein